MSELRTEGTGPRDCDLIIRNGYVITLDPNDRIFTAGALAIEGSVIADLGPEAQILSRYRSDRVIDARGATVHPGLIDAHNHIVHGTSRGVFGSGMAANPNVTFADWKAGVTSDDEFVATQLAALEMLHRGFTAFVEPGTAFDTDAIAAGAVSVGVRAFLAAPYLWDQVEVMRQLPALESQSLYRRAAPDHERCLKELDRELRWNKNPDGRVHGYVSVYGLGTASDELLKAGKLAAGTAGVAFQQHEGYTPAASAADRQRLGRSRIRHLHEIGVLNAGSTLIHMYVFEEGDLDILARAGIAIVTCPVAYLELGISAEAGWHALDYCDRGISVALGTDGARSCVIGDAGLCAYLIGASAGRRIAPAALLKMQSIEAARSVCADDRIGSLEPGKRADIVIRRSDSPELYPGVNPVHHLALTAHGDSVDTVVVNGDVVMRYGRSCCVDEELILANARSSVTQRMARLGLA